MICGFFITRMSIYVKKSCGYDCTGLCTECSAILCNFRYSEYECKTLSADFHNRSLDTKSTNDFTKTKQKGGSHDM